MRRKGFGTVVEYLHMIKLGKRKSSIISTILFLVLSVLLYSFLLNQFCLPGSSCRADLDTIIGLLFLGLFEIIILIVSVFVYRTLK